MPTKTIKVSIYALGISAAFVASSAQAQSAPPPGDGQPAPAQTTATAPPPSLGAASDKVPPAAATTPVGAPDKLGPPAVTPPAPPPAPPAFTPSPTVVEGWYVRPAFELSAGKPDNPWKLGVYGFAELDIENDSTRSYNDGSLGAVLARNGTQAGTYGRTQFTVRNSRLGFKATAPTIDGIKGTGVVEADFFGYDPTIYTATSQTEASFYQTPTFRIRHAYVKAESDAVSLLAGQTSHLFGWQGSFFPMSLAFLGLPMELFNRTAQFRLTHTFKSDDVNFDIAVAAVRPAQRDSSIPDGEAGLRLSFNNWKGLDTASSGATVVLPAGIGVSGLMRRFKVDQFSATPSGNSTDNGWAVAGNFLLPLLSASDTTDRMNKLTLIGEFTVGSGYADQFNGNAQGAAWPKLPGGATYSPDIDNGMVTYDPSGNGVLHTINWRTFVVGAQWYLGRFVLGANYTQGDSDNMADLFPKSTSVLKKAQYADGTVLFDMTPAIRLGLSYQFVLQTFCDDATARNHRFEGTAIYFF